MLAKFIFPVWYTANYQTGQLLLLLSIMDTVASFSVAPATDKTNSNSTQEKSLSINDNAMVDRDIYSACPAVPETVPEGRQLSKVLVVPDDVTDIHWISEELILAGCRVQFCSCQDLHSLSKYSFDLFNTTSFNLGSNIYQNDKGATTTTSNVDNFFISHNNYKNNNSNNTNQPDVNKLEIISAVEYAQTVATANAHSGTGSRDNSNNSTCVVRLSMISAPEPGVSSGSYVRFKSEMKDTMSAETLAFCPISVTSDNNSVRVKQMIAEELLVVPSVSRPEVGLVRETCPKVATAGRVFECLCVLLDRQNGGTVPHWYTQGGNVTGFSSEACGVAHLLFQLEAGATLTFICHGSQFYTPSDPRHITYRVKGRSNCLNRKIHMFVRLSYVMFSLAVTCLVLFSIVIISISQKVRFKQYLNNNDIRTVIKVRQQQLAKMFAQNGVRDSRKHSWTDITSFELPIFPESDQY